ncbi:peptidoglycan/xylan/chitin deacetylase (PgdA/CDA1 family) [Motilibacter peucedani]|uniref:Peptidoglycan/xylan/chitin deacetylase (PgdA/CDA1 family) n=1 Tax=Motilibacter peucedani TaxID=598650 RepID=A0A420XKJ8_9ACTN|nr:polysaccharide deacetylase family protein [Motilibacter peucedani]RKS68045.1 peptidoglycan/xylan/chitin deacetylase (PgdA/CDA1 family) [Motilibacter peucedani]
MPDLDRPVVALTFDDGPSSFRPRTLEVLREHGVPATFFDVGARVRANPHLVAFAAAEGHLVLNHTDTHPRLADLPDEQVRSEVRETEQALAAAGVEPAFKAVRPPFLSTDEGVRGVLSDLGYLEVLATFGVPDYDPATTAEQIVAEVLEKAEPGAVVVLHDGAIDSGAGAATVEALPAIITGLRERGYELGLLDASGSAVPATLQHRSDPVPPVQAPVPYRPLVHESPEPPAPWVVSVGVGPGAVEAMWRDYCTATGADPDSLDVATAFGDSPAMADQLLELVLHGPKRATAGLLADFDAGTPLPSVGAHWIVLDGTGAPACVLQTTDVRTGLLGSVDDAFALDEGEGDRTRGDWLAGHRRYFERQGERRGTPFDETTEQVVFERFRVVWPPEVADR